MRHAQDVIQERPDTAELTPINPYAQNERTCDCEHDTAQSPNVLLSKSNLHTKMTIVTVHPVQSLGKKKQDKRDEKVI